MADNNSLTCQVDCFCDKGEDGNDTDAVAWVSIGIAVLAFLVALFNWYDNRFFRSLENSIRLRRQFSSSKGQESHAWNVCSWLLNAYSYEGVYFQNGKTSFFLDQDVYEYAAGISIYGENLTPAVREVVKGAMVDACDALTSFRALAERGKVDKKHLRGMVWSLAGKMYMSRHSIWTILYEDELRKLLILFHLPIPGEANNVPRTAGSWDFDAKGEWEDYHNGWCQNSTLPRFCQCIQVGGANVNEPRPQVPDPSPLPVPLQPAQLENLARAGWVPFVDQMTNRRYYFNPSSGLSSWDMPRGL